MFALAVAMREVFPAVWTTHEVLARAKAVQEALSRTVPLQEVLARVLVVREVLVRAVDGWNVFPTVVTTSETIVSSDRGARGVDARHQGPCTPLPPWFRRAASHVASAARRAAFMSWKGVGGAWTLPPLPMSGTPADTQSCRDAARRFIQPPRPLSRLE